MFSKILIMLASMLPYVSFLWDVQIVSDFPGQFGFEYPEAYTRVAKELSNIFSLSFMSLVPAECAWDAREDRYYRTLVFGTTAPLVVVAMGIIFYTTKRLSIRKSTKDNKEAEMKVEELYAVMMEAFLAFSYTIFVPCSQVVLAYFNCTPELNGLASFLKVDPTTQCWTKTYSYYFSYALAMVFVYPLGIPFLYLSFLRRHRDDIDPIVPSTGRRGRMLEDAKNTHDAIAIRMENKAIKPLSFLFDAYEPEYDDVIRYSLQPPPWLFLLFVTMHFCSFIPFLTPHFFLAKTRTGTGGLSALCA